MSEIQYKSSGAGGNIVNPASATDNAVARFDGVTGKIIQNSGVVIDDSGIVTGAQFNPTDELNVVNVYVAADLPDTLVAGTKYILRAPITVSTTKTFPGTGACEIASNNLSTNTLTYSGTGNLFEGTSVEGVRLHVQVNSSSTGTLFSVTGSGATAFFDIGSGGFDGWDNLGTLTSFGLVDMNFVTVTNFDSGLTLNSVVEFFSTQSHFFNASDQSTDYLTFDANILEISINNVSFVPIGNERIFNINSSASVDAFIDDITGVTTANLYFNTAGLVKTSPGIIISNASNIADSTTSAELTMSGNTATTDIPAVNALVEINLNANWVGEEVERLIVGTDGSVESIGLREIEIKIDANIHLEPATATKDLSCSVVLVDPPPFTVTFTNGTNLINETSTALLDGDTISFRDTAGTLPAELRTDVIYYVVSQLTNSFQVSYTSGGAAITFTDNGTPVNAYQIATLHGSTPINSISAGTPRDLIAQAMMPANLGSDSFLVVFNTTDAVDINVNSGYQRYFG